MGKMRKIVILLFVYFITGVFWSYLIRNGHLPPLENMMDPLSILYYIFLPVNVIYLILVDLYSTYVPD